MRELDLSNRNIINARMSIYQHYDDLEKELNDNPKDNLLLARLKITAEIIANIKGVMA